MSISCLRGSWIKNVKASSHAGLLVPYTVWIEHICNKETPKSIHMPQMVNMLYNKSNDVIPCSLWWCPGQRSAPWGWGPCYLSWTERKSSDSIMLTFKASFNKTRDSEKNSDVVYKLTGRSWARSRYTVKTAAEGWSAVLLDTVMFWFLPSTYIS